MSKITISHKNGVMELDIADFVRYLNGETGRIGGFHEPGKLYIHLVDGMTDVLKLYPTGAPNIYTTKGEELPFENIDFLSGMMAGRHYAGVDPGCARGSQAAVFVKETFPFPEPGMRRTTGDNYKVNSIQRHIDLTSPNISHLKIAKSIINDIESLGGKVKLTLERLED